MTKPPAFLWYPKDILGSARVAEMSLTEEGAYRRLLDFCWLNGSIPADPKRCARVIGKGATPEVAEYLSQMFVISPDDTTRLIHERLDAERQKQLERSKKAKDSAAARWNGRGTPKREVQSKAHEQAHGKQVKSTYDEDDKCETDANAYANAMRTQCSAIAVPIATKKEKDIPNGISKKKGVKRKKAVPKRKHRIPKNFSITNSMRAWAKKSVPKLDIEYQTVQFIDHWLGKDELAKDWTAKWRFWMRQSFTKFGDYPKGRPGLNGNNNGHNTNQNRRADAQSDEELLAEIGSKPKD